MNLGVKSITKTDLVKHMEKELKCSRRASLRVINNIFNYIQKCLESGYRVQLSPFGIFVARHHAGHRGRHPKTGETFLARARRIVVFKPGRALKNLKPKS